MKTQKVDVPEELLELLKESHLGVRPPDNLIRTALAIYLFQQGIISVGKAARLADEPRASFELLLGKMGIPPVTYELADYEEDLRGFTAAERRAKPA